MKSMKYYFDTEFIEKPQKIDLISIGIVSEDGRELYLVNSECRTIEADDWVRKNVLYTMFEYIGDGLECGFNCDCENVLTKKEIANEILKFIGYDSKPEFWAYYADYDWVVFCWLWGRMIDKPEHFPFYCKDLQQEIDALNLNKEKIIKLFPQENIHNSLDDARWVKKVCEYIESIEESEDEEI